MRPLPYVIATAAALRVRCSAPLIQPDNKMSRASSGYDISTQRCISLPGTVVSKAPVVGRQLPLVAHRCRAFFAATAAAAAGRDPRGGDVGQNEPGDVLQSRAH